MLFGQRLSVKLGLQFCLIPKLTFSDSSPFRSSRAAERRICNVEWLKGWTSEVRMVVFWPVSQETVGHNFCLAYPPGIRYLNILRMVDPSPPAGLPSEPWACQCGAGHGLNGQTWQAWGVRSTSLASSDHSSGSSTHPRCLSEVPSDCWSHTPWACLCKSNTEWPGFSGESAIFTVPPSPWSLSSPHTWSTYTSQTLTEASPTIPDPTYPSRF